MTNKNDINLRNFEAWGLGKHTLNRLIKEGACDTLEKILMDKELFPDGWSKEELNDFLSDDYEWIYKICGLKTIEELWEELEELDRLQEELEEKIIELEKKLGVCY